MSREKKDSTFGIGTVSQLTGIPMDTLRAWERRYGVVSPSRSTANRRFYSRDDIARLMLIKQLLDQGDTIGSVVKLDESQLRERVQLQADLTHRVVTPQLSIRGLDAPKPRLLVFGESLPFLVAEWISGSADIELLGAYTRYSDLAREAQNLRPDDILLLEFPALQAEELARLRELIRSGQLRQIVVVYSFASRSLLDRLEKMAVIRVRAPLTESQFVEICLGASRKAPFDTSLPADQMHQIGAIAPRRFSGQDLARIGETQSRLVCECPHHLAELVSKLSAFEQYSLECESSNHKDSAIHIRLHAMTAKARALLEEALAYVLDHESAPAERMASDLRDARPEGIPESGRHDRQVSGDRS